jgi:hypothetical protein
MALFLCNTTQALTPLTVGTHVYTADTKTQNINYTTLKFVILFDVVHSLVSAKISQPSWVTLLLETNNSKSPGANPTIVSNNATAVLISNAASSQARSENYSFFFYFEKTLQPTTTLALSS